MSPARIPCPIVRLRKLNPKEKRCRHLIGNQLNIRTKIQIASLLWLSTLFSISLAQTPASSAPAQVMMLGTYHFGNPGQDLHNMKADNVLTPKKQAELADVAARLARFKPTEMAVEPLPNAPI
jgi:hypothetical protein